MTHAEPEPSYVELAIMAAELRIECRRLTRERDEWKKKYNCLFDRYDRLDDRVTELEGELRRLRDLVGIDDFVDVAIIDEVLHG